MISEKITVQRLQRGDLVAATDVCANAMRDNPIHVRVFGAAPARRLSRLRRFFPGMLRYVYRKGDLYGAFVQERLIGVIGLLPPERCKPSVRDLLRLFPSFVVSNSPFGVVRLSIWLGTWAKIDPGTKHYHLGPLAIDPEWQRRGIGTQLFQFACNKGEGHKLYLETDRLSNVQLYEKLGFATLSEPIILGTPSWVMMR